jgi:hypothetical protein
MLVEVKRLPLGAEVMDCDGLESVELPTTVTVVVPRMTDCVLDVDEWVDEEEDACEEVLLCASTDEARAAKMTGNMRRVNMVWQR